MLSRIKELFGFGDSNNGDGSFNSGDSSYSRNISGNNSNSNNNNTAGQNSHNNYDNSDNSDNGNGDYGVSGNGQGYTRDKNGNINEPVQIRYVSGDGKERRSIPEIIVGGAFGFVSAALGKAFKGIAGFFATILAIMGLGFILIEFFASPIMLNFSGISHGVSFNLPNEYGEMVSSESLVGEPYVLFFGSSTCSDCLAQRSQLKEIEKSGIKVIGVLPSVDARNLEYASFYSNMFTSVLLDENDTLFNGMSMVILPNMLVMNGNGEPIYDAMKSISNNDVDKITRMFEQYKKAHPNAYVEPTNNSESANQAEKEPSQPSEAGQVNQPVSQQGNQQQLSQNEIELINDVVLESEAAEKAKIAKMEKEKMEKNGQKNQNNKNSQNSKNGKGENGKK